jgi:hypothetical protein
MLTNTVKRNMSAYSAGERAAFQHRPPRSGNGGVEMSDTHTVDWNTSRASFIPL